MKKEKRAEHKKEFRTAPFKGLKEFTANPEHPVARKVPLTPKPPALPDQDDNELFLRHVKGIKKLGEEETKKKPESRSGVQDEKARPGDAEDSRLFLSSLAGMDITFRDEFPDVEPLRPMAVNRMRQLKTGSIRIDLELDLHGLTREEALNSLNQFISGAFRRGQKAVLVITGKGNNSSAEPVLQGAVASWLREKGKAMVAEFAPAPARMGGNGAFVVFLKDKKV